MPSGFLRKGNSFFSIAVLLLGATRNTSHTFYLISARHTVPDEEISWDDAMAVIEKSEEVYPEDRPSPAQLLAIRAARPTQTLAALVNESR